jgi:predicted O-linked N-acetylglucosamine transferase (SPINDLY family)
VIGGIPDLERAIALDPGDADNWHRLAVALSDAGRFDEVARCCRRVLEIDPQHAKAHANLGAVLQRRGADDEAVQHYREAIAADPALAPPRFSLGVLLLAGGRRGEAIEQMRRAVALDPGRAEWHAILGEACSDAGRPLDARSSLETALRLAPDSAGAHEQLGCCLLESGDAPGAVAHFRRALEIAPDLSTAVSNRLFALNCVFDERPEAIFAAHAAWGQGISRGRPDRARANDPNPERRLTVGYVSPDFRDHALAYFIEPVLAQHDRTQFDVVCYSDAARDDSVTTRLRLHAALWRESAQLDTEALAQKIRDDRIDILVDLAGHSVGGKRMPVFALKPAPLQASWLGYLNTTGLPAMDYRITDAIACPQGWERYHTERLLRLPDSQWCFAAAACAPAIGPLPAGRGAAVTFGALHNLAKVSPRVIALWSRLLHRVPGSRLLMLAPGQEQSFPQLAMQFAANGIDAARIQFTGRLPIADYLELHNRIDINLDAFPYTGGTTTCHSLWMGVPVVTMQGANVVSRGGASLLNAVGLPELVADSESQYLEIAEQLAGDLKRLALLRSGLRQRVAQSPLMDAARFTANLESAYRGIWRRWCAGAGP